MSQPMITSISPGEGPSSGGTQVEIAGSGLSTATDADDVQFGDQGAASIVSVIDSLLIVMTPPAVRAGPVPITVFTPNGAVVWEGAFDYLVYAQGISPASGPVTGGTTVTISGSGLSLVSGIQFGAAAALITGAATDTAITVTAPAATAAGSVDVQLLGPSGAVLVTQPNWFTYDTAPASATTGSDGTTGSGGSTGSGGNVGSGGTTGSSGTAGSGGTTGSGTTGASGSTTTTTTTTTGPAPSGQQSPSPSGQPAQQGTAAPPASAPPASTTTTAPAASGQQSPSPSGQPAQPGPAGAPPASGGAAQTPAPGSYIPGGLAPLPSGQTGLGTSAGSGAGFGVGTLLAGGGGSAPPGNLAYYVDPGLSAQIVQALIGLVQTATSPDAIEAQNMILRRMALEGDVVGSRIPPPRNVSEIGGYLNLLSGLQENTMREQALAGILGVAGPAQPLGWITNDLPLSMVAVPNDRPAVAAQPSFPLSFLVRSDFVAGIENAFEVLHSYGATLPLTSPSVITLPPGGTGATIPQPVLLYLGRVLMIAPSAALDNPATDPVALVMPNGAASGYVLASQVLNPATYTVPAADLLALQCTPTACVAIQLDAVEYVPIASILATAGFYSPTPLPVPATLAQTAWTTLTNITGLVAGVTTLGEELSLLHRQDQIAASAFAAMLTWTWTGTTFAP